MSSSPQPADEAAKLLYVSMVVGGKTPENARVISAIDELTRTVDELCPAPRPDDLRIDLIFDVPGPILGNDYEGNRNGRFVPQKCLLVVQAAVPAEIEGEDIPNYLKKALADTIGVAKAYAKRRKLPLSTDALERAVGELIARLPPPRRSPRLPP